MCKKDEKIIFINIVKCDKLYHTSLRKNVKNILHKYIKQQKNLKLNRSKVTSVDYTK